MGGACGDRPYGANDDARLGAGAGAGSAPGQRARAELALGGGRHCFGAASQQLAEGVLVEDADA